MVRTLITYFEFYTLFGKPRTHPPSLMRGAALVGSTRPFWAGLGCFNHWLRDSHSRKKWSFAFPFPVLGVSPCPPTVPSAKDIGIAHKHPQIGAVGAREASLGTEERMGKEKRYQKAPSSAHHPEEYINVYDFQDKASLRLPRNILPVPFSI